jgi:hypothetical protein
MYGMVKSEYSKPQQVDLNIGLRHAYVDPEFAKLTHDDDDASVRLKMCAIINIMLRNCDKRVFVGT